MNQILQSLKGYFSKHMQINSKERYSFLQVLLTVISVSCLLISNIIAAKQMQLPFGITMTGAVFVFPITYILSDVFSEVYGYKWSRITCYIGFALNVFMVGIFKLAIVSPAPDFWSNQEAFAAVLGSAPRTLIASLAAFLAGDFVNDIIFRKMKEKHPDDHRKFSVRAILSSFAGEMADSLIFVPIAFLGEMPISALIQMMVVQILLKTAYEIVILPVTNLIVKRVDQYEQIA